MIFGIAFGLNQAGGMLAGGLGAGADAGVAAAAAPVASTRGGNRGTPAGRRKSIFRLLLPEDLLDLKRVLQAAGNDYQAKGGFKRAARRVPGRVRVRAAGRFDEIHLSAEAEAGLREIALGNLQKAAEAAVPSSGLAISTPPAPSVWPAVVVIVASCAVIWLVF